MLAQSQVTSVAEVAVLRVRGVPWGQIIFNPRGLTWKRWQHEGRVNVEQLGPVRWAEGGRGDRVRADSVTQVTVSSVLWELGWGGGVRTE